MRSKDEIQLRDDDALDYDKWYLERGVVAVDIEDETILKKLAFLDNDKFLDFGCGTGRFTSICRDNYPSLDIYGLDISPKSIEILKSKNKKIEAQTFDASTDKMSDINLQKFDKVLSMQMIQHLDKDGAINAVNEIYNSLNQGG